MRKYLAAAGGTVAILATIACGSGTTSRPGAVGTPNVTIESPKGVTTVAVGSPITLDSDLIGEKSTAVITVKSAKITQEGGNDFDTPKGEYVVADVLIECKAGTCHANPFNFGIVAADGSRAEPTASFFDPSLNAVDLQGGEKVAGTVAFDVAKGTGKTSKIVVKETYGSKTAASWTLS